MCSEHFKGGMKTYLNNVPTIFPYQKPTRETGQDAQVEQASNQLEETAEVEVHVNKKEKEVTYTEVVSQVEVQVDE